MKCDSCNKYFTARDTPEYSLLKRGGQKNKRFCSFKCLKVYVAEEAGTTTGRIGGLFMIWDNQGVDSGLDMEQFEQALEARIERRIAYNPRCIISTRFIVRTVLRRDMGLTNTSNQELLSLMGNRSFELFYRLANESLERAGGTVWDRTKVAGKKKWKFKRRRER